MSKLLFHNKSLLFTGKFYCIDHFRKQKPDHRSQEIIKRKEAFLSCALEEQTKETLYKTLLENTEKALSPNKPAQSASSTPTKETSKTPEGQIPEKLSTPSNLLTEPAAPYGRDQTPERVEYENSIIEMSEEELLTSELEEEELTQKNLGPSQDLATSDDEYSDLRYKKEYFLYILLVLVNLVSVVPFCYQSCFSKMDICMLSALFSYCL